MKRIRAQVERQVEGRRVAEETAAEAEAAGVALRTQLAELTEAARKRQEALEQELADTSQVRKLIYYCMAFSSKLFYCKSNNLYYKITTIFCVYFKIVKQNFVFFSLFFFQSQ